MVPDHDNVYGIVKAPRGLPQIRDALGGAAPWRGVRITDPIDPRDEQLRLTMESAEFEAYFDSGDDYLLNGAVGGSLEEVVAFAQRLAHALSTRGLAHQIEAYDDNDELAWRTPFLGTGQ